MLAKISLQVVAMAQQVAKVATAAAVKNCKLFTIVTARQKNKI
jgi:hypothetical protein